jgi:O-antigen/teichoic acid export membrane protein
MKLIAAAVFIFLSCTAHAQDWTSTDTAMLTAAIALLAMACIYGVYIWRMPPLSPKTGKPCDEDVPDRDYLDSTKN